MTPALAHAAARFASPTGTGTKCSSASPCEITTAINSATGGDDITVGAGTYGSAAAPLTATLTDDGATLIVHGAVGSRPVIYTQAPIGLSLSGPASNVSNLDIESSSANGAALAAIKTGETVSRVVAHASGATAYACGAAATITDSVCWATGLGGTALIAGRITNATVTQALRNDTFYASGASGTGVSVIAHTSAHLTELISNDIVHGAKVGITADADGTSSNNVVADHSNFATTQTTGQAGNSTVTAAGTSTNQLAAPMFLNAAAGDFREATGAVTVDSGTDSPSNGPLDLAGNPRATGPRTDIGAYELMLYVTTAPPTATSTTATLAGTVNPSGTSATAYFEYTSDPTFATYGSTATQSLPTASTPQPVSAPISGLVANSTYYARLLAAGADGALLVGAVQAFTTPPPTPPPPPPTPAPTPTPTPPQASSLPTVTSISSPTLTSDGAKLGAMVNANGHIAMAAWIYGTDPKLAGARTTIPQTIGAGSTSVPVAATVGGLRPGTTYYYRLALSGGGGATYGPVLSFLSSSPPRVRLNTHQRGEVVTGSIVIAQPGTRVVVALSIDPTQFKHTAIAASRTFGIGRLVVRRARRGALHFRVRLNHQGRRALATHRQLRVNVGFTIRLPGGLSFHIVRTILLRL